MFKSHADESPKAATMGKEAKKGTRNLDKAIQKAAKAGKKLSDSAILRVGLAGAKQTIQLFTPRNSSGSVSARGIRGRVGAKASDTQLALRKIQRLDQKGAQNAAALFSGKSGKLLVASMTREATKAGGKKGAALVKAVINGIRKRAAGKNVAKLPKSTRPTKKK
jgi:hypothetical protein